MYVFMSVYHMPAIPEEAREALDPLGLQLQKVMRYHVGVGN